MTIPPILAVVFFLAALLPAAHGLGAGATVAAAYGSATVCGVVSGQPTRPVRCYRGGRLLAVEPNVSFTEVSGGRGYFCGLRSGGSTFLCWDILNSNSTLVPRRVYRKESAPLKSLAVGDDQVCALVNATGEVKCWRIDDTFQVPSGADRFSSISSGFGFSCGITMNTSHVRCWGSRQILDAIQVQDGFGNMPMSSIVAGANHSCAIRQVNDTVTCWGGDGQYSANGTDVISFESIVSGSNFTCGLTSGNLSIICWGPGWPSESVGGLAELPLTGILPGPCVQSACECGIYGLSQSLCSGSGVICQPCTNQLQFPPPPSQSMPPPLPPAPISPPSSPSRALRRGLLAFAIVGSVGALAGICTMIYCLWSGVCFGKKKVHNSVQPTITRGNSNGGTTSNTSPPSRSSTIRRQSSRAMRRQRSGTSSKHADKAEEFSLEELAAATGDFSLENKIGAGSFGVVYRGKLLDGREVAIKRSETGPRTKKFQEKESAFESEISFLSRLHHKHLVRLVGYCEEKEERLIVYEYMKNGALYDHLHNKDNVEGSSSPVNSWKMRIKIALDAARGIEYLHNYAVPPIIHRDIKSSNILLDTYWTARVSDFGLSLMGPASDRDLRPSKAAGTVGYIDPEYYGLNVLTAKSDVYGLGVVLLELLTGKRAIFKSGEDGGTPISIVDFAVPVIMAGELAKILDSRVGSPESNEADAVELVAYTAMHCVNLEGKDRPTMTDIVANLERALTLCEDSHGSISSGTISIVSE
ncbi:putative serine/threonine-protein kinase-like protein CCR3 isoform X2 [Syzygium oleosum]|uniref:putative serine/threonine-protein kinase-like protein CCR3 isoform X2 n=1 Tax=Syzygium oleosum TaxID=219896 RepID=UPI0024BA39D6|nr:putative serine/threonine-protein kinase-like protein CCR3 isoform X2 [Syzygium oleosum]